MIVAVATPIYGCGADLASGQTLLNYSELPIASIDLTLKTVEYTTTNTNL
jgi:hypothetical protein